jgi:hypothetical protein
MHNGRTLRIISMLGVLAIGALLPAKAQDKAAITQELTSKYALTKTTADRSDIVTAGAILVLKKDNLLTVDVTGNNPFQNTYKDGKITQNALGKLSRFHFPGAPSAPSPTNGAAQRTFVAGEKMWVTNITVRDAGVDVELYSDAIDNIRYRAVLTFPFRGSDPIGQQADRLLAEVFDVQPSDDSGGGQQQAAAPSGAQPAQAAGQTQQAEAAPPPIAPPPPPADEPPPAPKTVALGQTKDIVVANFGQPQKVAKLANNKEIYFYPDFKVTFVNGKVTDVQ